MDWEILALTYILFCVINPTENISHYITWVCHIHNTLNCYSTKHKALTIEQLNLEVFHNQ